MAVDKGVEGLHTCDFDACQSKSCTVSLHLEGRYLRCFSSKAIFVLLFCFVFFFISGFLPAFFFFFFAAK